MAFHTPGEGDEAMSEINVTPLVDVMLVLLVVFIVTAPLLTNAIHVNLPETAQTTSPDDPRALTLSVTEGGDVFLDKIAVKLDQLPATLAARKSANPQVSLFLQADDAARYGLVAKVMATIERSGISKLSVITKAE